MIKKSLFYCLQFFSYITPFIFTHDILAVNRIPEFQTTRLKATGGAGVASFLMDEATILNPAPLAFFKNGSIYLQKSGGDAQFSDTQNSVADSQSNDQTSVIVSDSKSQVKGSLSYVNQNYRSSRRKQFAASFSSMAGKRSAIGVSYRRRTDFLESGLEDAYNQTTFGVTHALNENFTLGMVFIDPFKKRPQDTRAIIGAQYTYQDFVSFMFDGGADYNSTLGETALWNTAIQAKIFSDFYLRFGVFNNKGLMEKGTGAGIGWIQPRLVVDFAIKNTSVLESSSLAQSAEDIKETSFSLSYRF